MQSIIKVLLSGYLVFCSCNSGNSGIGIDLNTINPITSNVSIPVLWKTLPASWDENWFSSPAVYDLNSDGNQEIIASRHSVLYVWNSDGSLKWRAPVGENSSTSNDHGTHRMYCSPVIADLDNDGLGEIAISYNNQAAVYDHDGNLQPGWPQSFPGLQGEIRSLCAADIDNDQRIEILVVKTGKGPVTNIWNIDGTQKNGWPQIDDPSTKNDFGGYNQNIGSTDLDGDGTYDVVSSYDICHIGVFYGNGTSWKAHDQFAGQYSCNVPMFHDINLAIQGWGPDNHDRDEFTDSPPVFADIDNDGINEIILFSDHELAGEYKNRGNSLWVLNPDMTRISGFNTPVVTGMPLFTGYKNNIVQVCPSPCISYLSTTSPYIIVPSYDGFFRCYSAQGIMQWQVPFDAASGSFIGASEAVAGDLDDDGIVEIIFTTYSIDKDISNLIILNAKGDLLHRVPLYGRGSMAAPCLADVDGDNIVEIVISLKDTLGKGFGGVQIWKVPSAKKNILEWPTGRGNYMRNGSYQKI